MSVKRKARPSRFAAGNRFDQKNFALPLSEDEMGGIRRHGRQPGRIDTDAGAAAWKRSQFRQAARGNGLLIENRRRKPLQTCFQGGLVLAVMYRGNERGEYYGKRKKK